MYSALNYFIISLLGSCEVSKLTRLLPNLSNYVEWLIVFYIPISLYGGTAVEFSFHHFLWRNFESRHYQISNIEYQNSQRGRNQAYIAEAIPNSRAQHDMQIKIYRLFQIQFPS